MLKNNLIKIVLPLAILSLFGVIGFFYFQSQNSNSNFGLNTVNNISTKQEDSSSIIKMDDLKPVTLKTSKLPLVFISGGGYPNLESAKNSNQKDKEFFTSLLDQNNQELESPKLQTNSEVVGSDNIYYISLPESSEIISLDLKNRDYSIKKIPIKFSSVQKVGNRLFLTEYLDELSGDELFTRCGQQTDPIGKCKIFELILETMETKEIVKAVRPGAYAGFDDRIAEINDDFIWIYQDFADGGVSKTEFQKIDLITGKLVSTLTIETLSDSDNFTYTLDFTESGKKKINLSKITCSWEISIQECEKKNNIEELIFEYLPQSAWQNYNLSTQGVNKCGDFDYDPYRTDTRNQNSGLPLLYKNVKALSLEAANVDNFKCLG